MFIDSHCHLNYPEFKDDLGETLDRARSLNIKKFLTINTCLSETKAIQDITDTFEDVYSTVGVHPHNADQHNLKTLYKDMEDFCKHPKVLGLGETGLDYFYENSKRETQQESFSIHCELSKINKKPLIVHTRDAEDDTVHILKNHDGVTGVIHCFSGSKDLARKCLDLGFYISLSGILTFKKADSLREVAKFVPMDRLLVETDAPYLSPVPHRGKRNESAFMIETAKVLADLKEVSLDKIAEQTTKNFHALFNHTYS